MGELHEKQRHYTSKIFPVHAMKAYGGEDVYLHSLLALTLDVAELPASQKGLWSTDIVIWLFGSLVIWLVS